MKPIRIRGSDLAFVTLPELYITPPRTKRQPKRSPLFTGDAVS